MWPTYRKLFEELKQAQARPYRSEPERDAALSQTVQEILQTILEKMAAAEGPIPIGQESPE
jgi:hypothetical protein